MSVFRLVLVAMFALVLCDPSAAQGLPRAERFPGLPEGVVDLDVQGDRWAVVFEDGAVRVHNPGGSDYRLKAVRVRADETDDAILRVEGLLDDVSALEDAVEADVEADVEGDVDVEGEVTDTVEDEVGGDTADRLEELLQGEGSIRVGEQRFSGRSLIRWGVGERIAVSRSDGVWTSDDGGRRWSRISRDPARAMADNGREWVLILESGETFIDGSVDRIYLGPLPLEIAALDASDGTVWAATDVGLWRYANEQWEPIGTDFTGLRQILADPGWEGGLWAADRSGIRRSDDGGLTWRALDGGPRRGKLAWGGPQPGGGLLVVADVLWLHAEGTWTRDARGLDFAILTEAGLFGITQGALLTPPLEIEAGPDIVPEWIPLRTLLFTALSRRELNESIGLGRVAQTLMPEVVLEGTYRPQRDISYLPYTTDSLSAETKLFVRLTWTPAGRSGASQAFDQTIEEIALRTGFDDLGIAGDRGVLAAVGGRVGRSATKYRNKLADDVRDLHAARNALFFERAALPPETLTEQVVWQLRLLELEARLDVLTDGAVSAWNLDAG